MTPRPKFDVDQGPRNRFVVNAAMKTIPVRYAWSSYDSPLLGARVRARPGEDPLGRAREVVLAGRSLVLRGASSVGKTVLAVAAFRAALERPNKPPRSAMFVGAYWLAKARQEHPLGRGEALLVERALTVDLLLFDDVGIEQASNTAVAEVIYERFEQDRRTIFTTFLDVDAASGRYGDGVARRLFGEGDCIVLGSGGR